MLDSKVGTCSNLPVLYLALAHRLGWPLKAVVSRDHMWCRWDDGKPGGKRFNIEATNAASDGESGSFTSGTDDDYAKSLGTTRLAIDCGSDLASLTARQTLGVYLQARAAYWDSRGHWEKAEADLLAARLCFPQNREIFGFLVRVMDRRAIAIFTQPEHMAMARLLARSQLSSQPPRRVPAPQDPLEALRQVEEMNEANRRRTQPTGPLPR